MRDGVHIPSEVKLLAGYRCLAPGVLLILFALGVLLAVNPPGN